MGKLKQFILNLFKCVSKEPSKSQIQKIEETEEWINYVDDLIRETVKEEVDNTVNKSILKKPLENASTEDRVRSTMTRSVYFELPDQPSRQRTHHSH